MKRYGDLFDKVFNEDNLLSAFLDSARTKRQGWACYDYERRLHPNLSELSSRVFSGTYRPKPYNVFYVREPKERIIYAPHFEDTVVQHAIYRIIYPIFDRSFIDQSFACRYGKGTHKAADYAQKALRATPNGYTLKLDIEKYFYSIDRDILKSLVRKKIKDKRLLAIIDLFIDYDKPTGIPIGNLLSQLFALIYLNEVDHFIKRELKVKWYCRYVDDFVLFGLDRKEALSLKSRIEDYLEQKMKLKLSFWEVKHHTKGVNFVGYRTWKSRRFIRKYSLYKFRKRAKQGRVESVISLLAHARNTSSFNHMRETLNREFHAIYLQLPEAYR